MTRLRHSAALCFLLLCATLAPAEPPANAELQSVLDRMDAAAAGFRTTEAEFVWDQYQKVVDETDTQKGKVFFRRLNNETQMIAEITHPDLKYVLFADGKVRVYQPRIDQVTEYSAGKNKAEIESFLVLGFGGRGHDLLKSFDVSYEGAEAIDGTRTARLALVPKSQKGKSMFSRILLWIDPERGVSLKQQLFEPSGDHRIARYVNIRMNQKLADDIFRLKTTSKTTVVSPQV
ncbi:MAG: LolA family protein [Terriglobales bacterium]